MRTTVKEIRSAIKILQLHLPEKILAYDHMPNASLPHRVVVRNYHGTAYYTESHFLYGSTKTVLYGKVDAAIRAFDLAKRGNI